MDKITDSDAIRLAQYANNKSSKLEDGAWISICVLDECSAWQSNNFCYTTFLDLQRGVVPWLR